MPSYRSEPSKYVGSEKMENEQMQENELNETVAHEFREEVGDFVQIIGMDAEGNVLYTREEYPVCVESEATAVTE